MANAYSQIHNYRDPVTDPNMQLTGQLLQYKQQKYDHNKAKLQSIFDEFSSVDLHKDVDKDYAEGRLTQIKSLANKYMTGDLSSDALTSSIASNMDQFVDDKVINGMVSTKKFKSEMSEWEELKKKKPELFDERNKDYALAHSDYLRWSKSEEAGDTYKGGAGAFEYVDVDKNVLKELPKILKEIKSTWVEREPGSGMFYDNVTKEAVPREELQKALRLAIGDKGYRQLEINSWDEFRKVDPTAIIEHTDQYYNSKASRSKERVSRLEKLKNKETDSDRIAVYNELIQEAQTEFERNKNRTSKNSSNYDPESAYKNYFTERYEENILGAYSKEPKIIKRELDKNDFETKKFQESSRRYNLKQQQEAKKKEETETASIFSGSVVNVDAPEKEKGDVFDQMNQKVDLAIGKLNSTFANQSQEDREILATMSIKDLTESGGVVTLSDGSKKRLSTEERAAILEYRSVVNREGSGYKDINSLNSLFFEQVKDDFLKTFVSEQETSVPAIFKSFGKMPKQGLMGMKEDAEMSQLLSSKAPKIERTSDGYKIVGGENTIGEVFSNYITSKTRGEDLTEEEEIQTNLVIANMMLRDGGISDNVATEMKDYIVNKYQGKVEGIVDIIYKPESSSIANTLEGAEYLDILGIIDKGKDIFSPQYISGNSKNYNDIENLYKNTLEDKVKEYGNLILPTEVGITSDHPAYSLLRGQLELDKNFSNSIFISPKIEEGKSTGDWTVRTKKSTFSIDEEAKYKPKSLTLNPKQMAEVPIDFGEEEVTPWSIKFHGDNADILDLGTSKFNEDRLQSFVEANGEIPEARDSDVWKRIKDRFSDYPDSDIITQAVTEIERKYLDGELSFKVEPVGGSYYTRVYDGDKLIGANMDNPLGNHLSYTEVARLTGDASLVHKSSAVIKAVESMISTNSVKSYIKHLKIEQDARRGEL